MSEYVPTEEALKQAYVNGISANPCDDQDRCDVCTEAHAHVDRFLARAKAEAWDEGYWQGGNDVGSGLRENELTPNPYLEGQDDE